MNKKFFFSQVYVKTFGENCTDQAGECDSTKGLSCGGTTGAKTCLFVQIFMKIKLIIFANLVLL